MFCGNCGNQISDNNSFCEKCGSKIKSVNPSEAMTEEEKEQSPVGAIVTEIVTELENSVESSLTYKKTPLFMRSYMLISTLICFLPFFSKMFSITEPAFIRKVSYFFNIDIPESFSFFSLDILAIKIFSSAGDWADAFTENNIDETMFLIMLIGGIIISVGTIICMVNCLQYFLSLLLMRKKAVDCYIGAINKSLSVCVGSFLAVIIFNAIVGIKLISVGASLYCIGIMALISRILIGVFELKNSDKTDNKAFEESVISSAGEDSTNTHAPATPSASGEINDTASAHNADYPNASTDNESMLRDLIGRNANYYLKQFAKIGRGEISFNLFAFILGPIVVLYRKQFVFFAKVFLPSFITLIISLILQAIAITIGSSDLNGISSFFSSVYVICYFSGIVVCGIMFNKSYRKYLLTVIEQNHLATSDVTELEIKNAAKKTNPSVFVPIVVLLAIFIFSAGFRAVLGLPIVVEEQNNGTVDIQPSQDEKYIQLVKTGSLVLYPDISIEDAFKAFFAAPKWAYMKADSGEDVVEFTGECLYQEVTVKARLQFIINKEEEEETFEVGALSFNDVPQTELIKYALLAKAFEGEDYDSSSDSSGESVLPDTSALPDASISSKSETSSSEISSSEAYDIFTDDGKLSMQKIAFYTGTPQDLYAEFMDSLGDRYEVTMEKSSISLHRLDNIGLTISISPDGNIEKLTAVIGPDFADRVIVDDEFRLDMTPEEVVKMANESYAARRHGGASVEEGIDEGSGSAFAKIHLDLGIYNILYEFDEYWGTTVTLFPDR